MGTKWMVVVSNNAFTALLVEYWVANCVRSLTNYNKQSNKNEHTWVMMYTTVAGDILHKELIVRIKLANLCITIL